MAQNMKERTKTAKKMVKECFILRMEANMWESSKITKYRELASITGVTGKSIKDSGKIIK